MIVVDTSVISHLFLTGEYTAEAERVRALDPEWIAPWIWLSEFRNVLRKYMQAGLLSIDDVLLIVNEAEHLMVDRSFSVPSADVLRLVNETGCTAYDGEFVALAQSLRLPLVTLDRELLRLFPDRAIHPADFQH